MKFFRSPRTAGAAKAGVHGLDAASGRCELAATNRVALSFLVAAALHHGRVPLAA